MFEISWTIQLLFIPVFSPLFIGVIRKFKAIFQGRCGASIFQPYRDLWKLFHKDEILSPDASWIFRFAPIFIFTATLVVGTSIPTFSSLTGNGLTSDILVIIYTLAIGTFFLALAGMDTGSGFGGFGSSREMALSALAEGGFIFSLLTVAIINGSGNVFTISNMSFGSFGGSILPVTISFIAFFIILLAETARFPFDNPATHLELTMIHEAMILEYSGKRLALIEWAAANKLLIFIALGSNLFFPFGIAGTLSVSAILIGILAFLIKAKIFSFAIAFLESTIAKFRLFRLPNLLFIAFILNCIAIILVK